MGVRSLSNLTITEPSQLVVSADSTTQSLSCNTGAAYVSVSGAAATHLYGTMVDN